MIAAARIRSHIRNQLVARSQFSGAGFNDPVRRRKFSRRISAGGRANRVQKDRTHIGDKTRQRPRRSRHMEHGFVFEKIAAHHIHVNIRSRPLAYLGMAGEKRHRALDFRPPDKTQCALRAGQYAGLDRPRQHARRFQNRHAPAAIVVGARALMIEVTTVDDFALAGIRSVRIGRIGLGPRNRRRYHRPMAGADRRLHVRIEPDRSAASQPRAQCFRGLARDHEGETRRLSRIQMSPAHDRLVEAGPRGGLIRHVADDACHPMRPNRERLHARKNAIR